jgi:exosome complex component RRP43
VIFSKYLLPDPSAFESPLCPSTITIALDTTDPSRPSTKPTEPKIRLIRQTGLGGYAGKTGFEVLGECIGESKNRIKELGKVLYNA